MESLLTSHESKVKNMVPGAMAELHLKMDHNVKSFQFDLTEVCNIARERNEIIEKQLFEFKTSIELKFKEIFDFLNNEVKKIDKLFLEFKEY